MGIVLGFSLFIGVFIGVLISVSLAVIAIILTRKASKQRQYVWRIFTLVTLVSLPVLIFVVYHYPYDTGTPGSNYALLFKYYFFSGLAYAAIPGAAAMLAFMATMFCRKYPAGAVQSVAPVARRPIHVLLPLFCLLSGFWLGRECIVFHDIAPCKSTLASAYGDGNRMIMTAVGLFKQGKYRESVRRFSEVIESGKLTVGKLGDIHARRGWAHIRLGNHGAAAADFERAIQFAPENADAFNGRGWSRAKRDQHNAALADFADAIKISPRYAMVYNNRGVALKDMGQHKEARADYSKAIELNNDPEAAACARLNRGASCLMDDPASAERDFAEILRDRLPMKEEAAVWLFISLRESGMSREGIAQRMAELIRDEDLLEWPVSALDLFQERITMDEFAASYWHPIPVKRLPRRAEMLFFAGQYWHNLGQMEKARDCFEKCVQLGVRDLNAI